LKKKLRAIEETYYFIYIGPYKRLSLFEYRTVDIKRKNVNRRIQKLLYSIFKFLEN